MNELAIGDIVAYLVEPTPQLGIIDNIGRLGKTKMYSVLIGGELGKEHESTFMLNYYRHELTKTHNIDDINNQIKALTEL